DESEDDDQPEDEDDEDQDDPDDDEEFGHGEGLDDDDVILEADDGERGCTVPAAPCLYLNRSELSSLKRTCSRFESEQAYLIRQSFCCPPRAMASPVGQSSGDFLESQRRIHALYMGMRATGQPYAPDAFTQVNPVNVSVHVSARLENVTMRGVLGGSVAFTRPDAGNGCVGGPPAGFDPR